MDTRERPADTPSATDLGLRKPVLPCQAHARTGYPPLVAEAQPDNRTGRHPPARHPAQRRPPSPSAHDLPSALYSVTSAPASPESV